MKLSRCVARSIVAHTSAAAAMPTGMVAPEQRERQPGEAEALGELVAVLAVLRVGEQRSRARSARRSPPEIRNVIITIRFGLMPDALAALGFSPDTRRSKPKRLRLSSDVVADADDDRDRQEALQHDVVGKWKPTARTAG